MLKNNLLFLMLFLSPSLLYSQNDKPLTLNAGFGLLYHTTDNNFISPLIYRGTGPAFKIGVDFRLNKLLLNSESVFSSIDLESNKSSHLDTVLHEDITIMSQTGCYLKVFDKSYGSLFIGLLGDIHMEIYKLSSSSNAVNDLENEFFQLGVAPAVKYEFQIMNHTISTGFYFPVINYIVRRQWYIYEGMIENEYYDPLEVLVNCGEIAYANEYLKIPLKIKYKYSFSEKFGISAEYEYTYISYENPRNTRSEYQSIIASIEVTL